MARFLSNMLRKYFASFAMSFAIIIFIAANENTGIRSERRLYLIEDKYIHGVYEAKTQKNYICSRMARLRRVPLCEKLFDQQHYKEELRIRFNYEAYQNRKPECEPQTLTIRTQNQLYTGIRQSMLSCPGRHDPVRSHWLLDDYADDVHVSDGPVADSLVVFRRERTAAADTFVVYEILYEFSFASLSYAIVTAYDTDRNWEAMKTVTVNEDEAELEGIYVREMHRAHDKRRERDLLLTTKDTIADLTEGELTALCFVVFDRDKYKRAGFRPRAPLQKRRKAVSPPAPNPLRFEHATEYDGARITRSMYKCQPRVDDESADHRATNVDLDRVRISAGARPNSYFVYTPHNSRLEDSPFRIREFVENLNLGRAMVPEDEAWRDELQQQQQTDDVVPERELVEKQYANEVRSALKKGDIVCDTLQSDQIIMLCVRLYEKAHYADHLGIHFNYRAALYTPRVCQKKELTFKTTELRRRREKLYQRMVPCPGRHEPRRSDWNLDDYKDAFHLSGGPDSHSVTVYRREWDASKEWIRVYDIREMATELKSLPPATITFERIRQEEARSAVWSFDDNPEEVEVIYVREMVREHPIDDVLATESKEMLTALCYALLDRTRYRQLHFRLNKTALLAWSPKGERNRIVFTNAKEYNRQKNEQTMVPCYGETEDGEGDWSSDEFLKQFEVSAGSRPNSFFVYHKALTEDEQAAYQVDEFVENLDINQLKPVRIEEAETEDKLRPKIAYSGKRQLDTESIRLAIQQPIVA